MRPDNQKLSLSFLASALSLALALPAYAPVAPFAAPQAPAPNADADKNQPSKDELAGTTRTVNFRADMEIADRLARALAFQRNKDYKEAFDQYLEVLHLDTPTLVRIDDNLFVSSRDFSLSKIRELPANFINSYRLTVDGEARGLFDRARVAMDVAALEDMSRKYFASSVGDEILDTLGEIYREQGKSALAASAWERLLRWCPQSAKDRAMIRVKIASSALDSSNPRLAELMTSEFAKEFPGRKITIAGKEVDGLAYLKGLLAQHGVTPGAAGSTAPAAKTWSEFGGSPERTGVMPASFRNDAWVWAFALPAWEGNPTGISAATTASGANVRVAIAGGNVNAVMVLNGQVMPAGAGSSGVGRLDKPFIPVYDSGRIYLSNGWGVAAVETGSGRLCWATPGYSKGAAGDRTGAAQQRSWGYHTCVVRDGVVYASIMSERNATVVALDAETGRMKWMVPAGDEPEYALLRGAFELSDPLLVGERIYVGVHRIAGQQDSYNLLCISLKDRRLLWTSFICEDSIAGQPYGYQQGPAGLTDLRIPAYHDGTIFVNTGFGGLAAVEALTGEIRWAYAYERWLPNPNRFGFGGAQPLRVPPTVNGGPLVVGDVLCVAPSDSALVYGLEASTGKTLWKVPREKQVTILGAGDGSLYMSGEELWWINLATGAVRRWANESLGWGGQGFVTADSIYVPTDDFIWRFDRLTGKLAAKIGLARDRDEAGNLILVDGQFLSVARREVHVFEIWDKARAQLNEDMKKNPADPLPYERMAQGLARQGDFAGAIKDYRRALACYDSRGQVSDQAYVLRLKQIMFGLYSRLTVQAAKAAKYEDGLQFALSMKDLSTDQASRLEALAEVLRFDQFLGRWVDMTAALQGMIEECPDVMYAFGSSTDTPAGMYAELEIAKILKDHGREPYASFDKKAADLVSTGKMEDYQKVIRVYPNSSHVGEALLGMSRVSASSGKYREAGRYMERFIRSGQVKDGPDRATALWLAGNYWELAGQPRRARSWYEQLVASFPDTRVAVDGAQRTVAEVVKAKFASPAFASAGFGEFTPILGLPLVQKWQLASLQGLFQDGTNLSDTDDGVILTRTNEGQLACVDMKSGKIRWKQAFIGVMRASLLGKNVLAIMGNNELVLLDGQTGARVWTFNPGKPMQQMASDDNLVTVSLMDPARGTFEIVALSPADGKEIWRHPMPAGRGMPQVLMSAADVVAVSQRPVTVTFLDRKTGEVTKDLGELGDGFMRDVPVVVNGERLLFTMTRAKSNRCYVSCYDLKKRENLWRVEPPGDQNGFRGLLGLKSFSASGESFALSSSIQLVTCMETDSGRVIWQKSVPPAGFNNQLVAVKGDDCFAVSVQGGGATRNTAVTRLALADGAVRWQTTLPEGSFGMEVSFSADEVVLPCMNYAVQQVGGGNITVPVGGRVHLLDRESGKVVQSLNPNADSRNAMQAYGAVRALMIDRRLWVVGPNVIVGYGAKED